MDRRLVSRVKGRVRRANRLVSHSGVPNILCWLLQDPETLEGVIMEGTIERCNRLVMSMIENCIKSTCHLPGSHPVPRLAVGAAFVMVPRLHQHLSQRLPRLRARCRRRRRGLVHNR